MSHNFSEEYKRARQSVLNGKFSADAEAVLKKLRSLMGDDGFDDTQAGALTEFHKAINLGQFSFKPLFGGQNLEPAQRVLSMANGYASKGTGRSYAGSADVVAASAALKMLLHTSFLAKKGASGFWVVNTPAKYRNWPSLELATLAGDERALLSRLAHKQEYFSAAQKKHMADGAQLARAQVQKALMALSGKGKGQELVKRWFETEDTTATDLAKITADLAAGLKKIQNTLLSNRLIFTDCPFYRGDDMEQSEAFVFSGSWKDAHKVVYIEKGFFAKGGNVLSGRANWARVIVHELTHSELDTDDYPQNNSYGWQGINPKDSKFKGNKAVLNAENWAYFVVDAAGGLTPSERAEALRLP
ncbi:MAG TPA: M35 family metallo-endopeptidase [Frateuria sp.]|uniref:M35 family metallo-endopeptidase n=1 Tax=Frateuria sp. TaxID=2211372 RepID=UPI002D80F2FF|nr:M35 family metallo-endopeptidase [Frateuria sp.]HET6803835.1 M35 family metallo-endopeptidase [Frateuria sp.]